MPVVPPSSPPRRGADRHSNSATSDSDLPSPPTPRQHQSQSQSQSHHQLQNPPPTTAQQPPQQPPPQLQTRHHHRPHHHQKNKQDEQQPPVGGEGGLKSWLRTWAPKKAPNQDEKQPQVQDTPYRGIFGVPLRESIAYANVAISLFENGDSYIYGYVPIVVAKCGVFLKEKATGVEGIFRLSGSEKRIKELKTVFDSPERYGKGLVWDGYTVHDAANVFRRYLNDLPEPVVPLDLYERFREPLKGATKKTVSDGDGPQFVEDFDLDGAVQKYQKLIMELPPLNRQLLLYILDLLAVFAAKADENRMTSQNLAAVFSPGIISHPAHAMAPVEYRLNQCVLIFLIENQDHFLIGMQAPPPAEPERTERAEQPRQVTLDTPEAQVPKTETATSGAVARTATAMVNIPANVPASTLIKPQSNSAIDASAPGPNANTPKPSEPNPLVAVAATTMLQDRNIQVDGGPPSTAMPMLQDAVGMVTAKPPPPSVPSISMPTGPEESSETQQVGIGISAGMAGIPSPNGLSRSKSVPSGGRNKLKKSRPVSGSPSIHSAQGSQTSLAAMQT